MKPFKRTKLIVLLSLMGITSQAQNRTEKSVEGNGDILPEREYIINEENL